MSRADSARTCRGGQHASVRRAVLLPCSVCFRPFCSPVRARYVPGRLHPPCAFNAPSWSTCSQATADAPPRKPTSPTSAAPSLRSFSKCNCPHKPRTPTAADLPGRTQPALPPIPTTIVLSVHPDYHCTGWSVVATTIYPPAATWCARHGQLTATVCSLMCEARCRPPMTAAPVHAQWPRMPPMVTPYTSSEAARLRASDTCTARAVGAWQGGGRRAGRGNRAPSCAWQQGASGPGVPVLRHG